MNWLRFYAPARARSLRPGAPLRPFVWLAAFNVVLLNAAAMFLASRPSGLETARIPGLVLLGVGGLHLLAFGAFLELERPVLWQKFALPGAIPQMLARATLFAVGLAALGALPSVVYTLRALSRTAEAVQALSFGAASLVALAFYQTALWLQRVSPNEATSPLAHLVRTLKLALLAAILASTLLVDVELDLLVPLFGLAAAFVAARWHGAAARVPYLLSLGATRPATLSATYALVTIVVTRAVQSLLLGILLRGTMPAWQAATLAFVLGGGVLLTASLLWRRYRGVSGWTERLGLGRGRGLGITLREGMLWSVPAIAGALAFWGVIEQRVATSTGPSLANTPMMTLFVGSLVAAVGVFCVAAPLIEEVLYRGMLYRSLRSGWGIALSLLVSAAVFAFDHPWIAVLPIFGLGVCTALAFERSRSLYAAMLVHALYNGVVVWKQFVG